MCAILRGEELDRYNRTTYALKWLNSSKGRTSTDYYNKDHYRDTLEFLIKHRGEKALECGIGTGEFFALGLSKAGKEVYGIDFSKDLLDNCAKLFKDEGIPERLVLNDMQDGIPFENSSFDETYAIGVMIFMRNLKDSINEMLRVTKPGGVVVFDMMNAWHISQFINYWYCVFESSKLGFNFINLLKKLKRSAGLKTHIKEVPEKVNYRLISPFKVMSILKRLPVEYEIRGYNVLLPLSLPLIGRLGNICEKVPLFSYGLKDNKILKYFGAKIVVIIRKK